MQCTAAVAVPAATQLSTEDATGQLLVPGQGAQVVPVRIGHREQSPGSVNLSAHHSYVQRCVLRLTTPNSQDDASSA